MIGRTRTEKDTRQSADRHMLTTPAQRAGKKSPWPRLNKNNPTLPVAVVARGDARAVLRTAYGYAGLLRIPERARGAGITPVFV